jgi:hypothetical protein
VLKNTGQLPADEPNGAHFSPRYPPFWARPATFPQKTTHCFEETVISSFESGLTPISRTEISLFSNDAGKTRFRYWHCLVRKMSNEESPFFGFPLLVFQIFSLRDDRAGRIDLSFAGKPDSFPVALQYTTG